MGVRAPAKTPGPSPKGRRPFLLAAGARLILAVTGADMMRPTRAPRLHTPVPAAPLACAGLRAASARAPTRGAGVGPGGAAGAGDGSCVRGEKKQ